MKRREVIQKKIAQESGTSIDPNYYLRILSSHENAPYSPCRHPRGDVQGLTLATAFFDLNKAIFRLHKGNPCVAVSSELYTDLNI